MRLQNWLSILSDRLTDTPASIRRQKKRARLLQMRTESLENRVLLTNAPPVLTINDGGGISIDEDTTATLPAGVINVSDPDAGANAIQGTVIVTNGTVTLGSTTGLTFSFNDTNGTGEGDGVDDTRMVFRGTLGDINAAIVDSTFSPDLDFNGSATIELIANDLGHSDGGGVGTPMTDTETLTITVDPINDSPVNTVPGSITLAEDPVSPFGFTGPNTISISDVDAGSGTLSVTLTSAQSATLDAGGMSGTSITLTDTVANINTQLAGLTYNPTTDFNGSDMITVVTNDGGNTGAPPLPGHPQAGASTLTDTDMINVTVTEVNDAPSAIGEDLSGSLTILEDTQTPIPFSALTANDSPGPANESGQTLSISNLPATSTNGGTLSLNSGNVIYTPPANFNGTDSFSYTVTDNGTTNGSPDPLSSTSVTATISVTAVNDAPIPGLVNDTTPVNTPVDIPLSSILAGAQTGPPHPAGTADDESGQTVSVTGVTSPTSNNGTVTIENAGTPGSPSDDFIRYTPDAEFAGVDTISYTLMDDGGTANMGQDSATGTISMTVTGVEITSITVASNPVDEGGSADVTAVFASDSASSTHTVEFDFDNDGMVDDSVTLSAGERTAMVTHTFGGDTTPQDQVRVRVTNDGNTALDDEETTGADGHAALNVTNLAPVASAFNVLEIPIGTGLFSDTITVSDPGDDALTATIDFGEGDGAQAVTVSNGSISLTNDYSDSITAAGQTFDVELVVSDGSLTDTINATLTVSGSVVSIAGPGSEVIEGSDAEFTVSLDAQATAPVSVALLLNDGTATAAGGDFDPINAPGLATSITFGIGEQTKTISVMTRQDGQIEPDETFSIDIAGVTGGEVNPSAASATATIDGSELQIAPIGDQKIGAGAAPVSITIVSSSSNGAAAALVGTSVPSFGNFVDNNDGTGTLTLTPDTGDIGTETIEITATDASGGTSVMFDVNVVAPATLFPAPPFAAINSAGGTVGDFEADNSFNTGLLFSTGATIDTSDPSVPAGTPESIFQTTRWDPRSGDELAYNIAAPAGDYQVNLYFAEIYTPAARVGGRVFDINIEGNLVSDDFDIFAEAGSANKGIVESFNITSTGPTIDIEFGHEVENPAVMAIEIIDRNAIPNNGPVLDSITPVSVAEGGSTTITVSATDPESDPITLSNNGLPSFATFNDNADGTATITIDPTTGDVGEYIIAVQAASGTPSLTDSTSFVLNVTAPLSPAVPPLSSGAGAAITTGTPATVEPTVSITGPSGPVAEGDNAVFTITLSEPFNEQIGVGIELTDGTATLASGDLAPLVQPGLDAVVGFDPGETSKEVSIRTLRDGQTEPDETFSLDIIGAATNSAMLTVTQASASATIAGADLTISPVANQTIAADTGTVDLIISSTSSDNSPAMLSIGSAPGFVDFTDNLDGTGTFTFNPAAADVGTTTIDIMAADSNTTTMTSFDLSVVAQNLLPQSISVTRINAGDGAVGNFSADQSFNTGLRFSTGAAIDTSDPSVPAGTPAELFQTTRYDVLGGPELSYNIDAPAGDYQVLLYFAEIYTPVGRVGGRVFDVSVEGNVVLDDFDIFAEAGAVNKGIVEVINVTTTGPTIDIDFTHVVENPAVMGIEIINVTPIIDAGPVVNAIPRQTVTVGSTLNIPVSASDTNQDPITLSLLGAPSFVTLNDNNDGTGTIEVAPTNGDQGEIALSVQAESGTQSLTDLTGFTLAVEDLMGGNP